MSSAIRRLMMSSSEGINTSNYLTIVSESNNFSVSLSKTACEYCIDGDGQWIYLPANTATKKINYGQRLSFKANAIPDYSDGIGTFKIYSYCRLEGNCMSMLFGDNAAGQVSLSGKNYAFKYLFEDCDILGVSKDFLPATTLSQECYYRMFAGSSLEEKVPSLPAASATYMCYYEMFADCNYLTVAPKLPALYLSDQCYYGMFRRCDWLITAPELPATRMSASCYAHMFENCSSLVSPPALPALELNSNCYEYMFYGCSSLTSAPILPATDLIYCNGCYNRMFYNCKGLKYIKALFKDIMSSSIYTMYWVYGVSNSGTFVCNKDLKGQTIQYGAHSIPEGWAVIYDGDDVMDLELPLTIEYGTQTRELFDSLNAYISKNGTTLINVWKEVNVNSGDITVKYNGRSYKIVKMQQFPSPSNTAVQYSIRLHIDSLSYFDIKTNTYEMTRYFD